MENLHDKREKNLDLKSPLYYNNRELSWLAFNERVLEEAFDDKNPILERLNFLAIFSSNMDEFFMVRVAGLKDQVKAGYQLCENKSGLTPLEQLQKIYKRAHRMIKLQDDFLTDYFLPSIKEQQIFFLGIDDLTVKQYEFVKKRFEAHIFPTLTPLAIDAYRPFPKLLNRSINLAVLLKNHSEKGEHVLAIVQVPHIFSRYITLPASNNKHMFILLEDVISHFIGQLFIGFEVESVSPFRITRNADLTIHEEGARDLLSEIEMELKRRKWGAAVRLEIKASTMNPSILRFLKGVLEVEEHDIYHIRGMIDLTFLNKFYDELSSTKLSHLTFETMLPQWPKDLQEEESIFEAAIKHDVLLHHPYESFQPIIDFISEAASDPHVLAIKQTLYRVSGNSPIVEALVRAAENGKQVTVLVELKARFDEYNNILWAKRLEQAGAHVIYGMTALKTHSKITLIVKQLGDKILRYVHLGTGNYNEKTATFYTDIGFITTKEAYGEDATNFFNYISGYSERPRWKLISTSPYQIRESLIFYIDQEIALHKQEGKGHIIAKMNSVTDKPLMMKLYEASQTGVKIDLIVRGICCLKPGIPGVSDNITVRSIVGRFLEHSRVFYFHHNGAEKVYFSSADWMTRNMERRIEILFPIEDQILVKRTKDILFLQLSDNVKARIQDREGTYHYAKRNSAEYEIDSQKRLFELAYQNNQSHIKIDD